MLVLTRKVGESVLLTGGIRITVTEVLNGKIRLGFEAPPAVQIYRSEIAPVGFDTTSQEQQPAAQQRAN